MKISAHQPDFLPWVGFWNKVVSTDHMIIRLRDVIDSQTGQRCTTPMGRLTIPVTGEGFYDKAVAIPNYRKLTARIMQDLMPRKNPYRERLEPILTCLNNLSKQSTPVTLAEFNSELLVTTASILGLNPATKFVFSTAVEKGMYADERLMESTDGLADGSPYTYYSGAGGREYMSPVRFLAPALFQRVIEKHDGMTVLHLIATLEDPMDAIQSCAIWEEW